jgi:hypothetical protein
MSLETPEGHREALDYWQEALAVLTAADDETSEGSRDVQVCHWMHPRCVHRGSVCGLDSQAVPPQHTGSLDCMCMSSHANLCTSCCVCSLEWQVFAHILPCMSISSHADHHKLALTLAAVSRMSTANWPRVLRCAGKPGAHRRLCNFNDETEHPLACCVPHCAHAPCRSKCMRRVRWP